MYKEQDMTDPDPRVYFNLEYAKENKIYHMLDYNIETSACTGYFKEIMDFLHEKIWILEEQDYLIFTQAVKLKSILMETL